MIPQDLSAELLPSQAGSPQPVSLQGVVPPQVQDLAFVLVTDKDIKQDES